MELCEKATADEFIVDDCARLASIHTLQNTYIMLANRIKIFALVDSF